MYSKLDQMRDQFRERLNFRPMGETKVHEIRVERSDNNNNNIDSSASKSDSYFTTNPIPNTKRYVSQNPIIDNKRSFNYSKINSNNSNKLNKLPVYPKNSTKTYSYKYGNKSDSIQESPKRPYEWTNRGKDKKSDSLLYNRFSPSSDTEKPFRSTNTEGMACRYCQRRFALSERLEKHESVCMSSLDKSRIKFNSFQQRVKGQPNDYLLIYENSLKNEPEMNQKKSNWRKKHEYTIAAIKTARGDVSSGIPTTAEIMASIQQPCDYCKRRFNDEAIKRHLPICAKLHHKNLLKI